MKVTRVCTLGLGRTGKEVAKMVLEQRDMKLVTAVCSSHNPHLGQDLNTIIGGKKTGVIIQSSDTLAHSLEHCPVDVAVDFSTPEAALENAETLAKHKVGIVIATTGFSDKQVARLHSLADEYATGIVYAPNITLGVNVMMLLANLATALLENYDCTIVETHFKEKKDAPSGTAKKLAEEIKRGRRHHSPMSREMDIPIHALRVGGVVGRHSLLLVGPNDKIEICHESFSRSVFAQGAIKAMRFVVGAQGFFEMRDVLDLERVLQRYLSENGTPKVLELPRLSPQLEEAEHIS